MDECPKPDLLNQRKLDPEGGIEDTMRTIQRPPSQLMTRTRSRPSTKARASTLSRPARSNQTIRILQNGRPRSISSHCGSELLAPALARSQEVRSGRLARGQKRRWPPTLGQLAKVAFAIAACKNKLAGASASAGAMVYYAGCAHAANQEAAAVAAAPSSAVFRRRSRPPAFAGAERAWVIVRCFADGARAA